MIPEAVAQTLGHIGLGASILNYLYERWRFRPQKPISVTPEAPAEHHSGYRVGQKLRMKRAVEHCGLRRGDIVTVREFSAYWLFDGDPEFYQSGDLMYFEEPVVPFLFDECDHTEWFEEI